MWQGIATCSWKVSQKIPENIDKICRFHQIINEPRGKKWKQIRKAQTNKSKMNESQ